MKGSMSGDAMAVEKGQDAQAAACAALCQEALQDREGPCADVLSPRTKINGIPSRLREATLLSGMILRSSLSTPVLRSKACCASRRRHGHWGDYRTQSDFPDDRTQRARRCTV